MEFKLTGRKTLTGIPSASGIEITGSDIYIMGDDSPCLFRLTGQFEIAEKFLIGDADAAVGGKIPKPEKTDLEAMAAWGNTLLLFGSGSKSPMRDALVTFDTKTKEVHPYTLTEFYNALCAAAGFSRKDLNIEAAVVIKNNLLLFNRGRNILFQLQVPDLLLHAEGKGKLPNAETIRAILPELKGREIGFSGAAATPDGKQIVFCASAEDTLNWIDDGEILGSYIGVFPINSLIDAFSPACIPITDRKSNIMKIKVESLAVKNIDSADLQLLMVTDTDGKESELIEAELKL